MQRTRRPLLPRMPQRHRCGRSTHLVKNGMMKEGTGALENCT